MPRPTPEDYKEALNVLEIHGSHTEAARVLGIPRETLRDRVKRAVELGHYPSNLEDDFDIGTLPDEVAPISELIERRKIEYKRKSDFSEARRLINVKVKMDGPIGICHFGDPHVDDPGTDILALEQHVEIVKKTKGMFGGNIGDQQNLWVGRLARLYGEQSTSAQESWVLTEWLIRSIQWLYIIGGNHDCWAGAGDPLKWITRNQKGVFEYHGARLNLDFPNGKEVRVNARHDFRGYSQWNPVHGPSKAIQMGWRDHILTAGHKHISGAAILKCPATGLISHALRCAGYKKYDRYAEELGLPDQNISPCVITVIDPRFEDNDPRLITVLWDVEEAAEFLTYKRKKHASL